MAEKIVRVPNVSCQHCVKTIKRELGELEHVTEIAVDAGTKTVLVRWESPLEWQAIGARLEEIGYPPEN